MKNASEIDIKQIVIEFNTNEDEFISKVKELKIPNSKKGLYKRSILEKYFSKKMKLEFESDIIAISNQKGGEGKTTISIFLSEALSEKHKVLLVDWDAQANATRLYINDPEKNIFQCLAYRGQKPLPLKDIIIKVNENLHIVPSSLSLANFTTPFERDDFELLKDALLPIRSSYEFIIIDCPPSLGLGLENALIAADYIIVPVQTRAFSIQGLQDLYSTIEKIKKKANPKLELLGAVLNQYESSRALSGLSNNIKKFFPVLDTLILRKESIPQIQAERKHLKDCGAGVRKNFQNLATEVMEKINVKKK